MANRGIDIIETKVRRDSLILLDLEGKYLSQEDHQRRSSLSKTTTALLLGEADPLSTVRQQEEDSFDLGAEPTLTTKSSEVSKTDSESGTSADGRGSLAEIGHLKKKISQFRSMYMLLSLWVGSQPFTGYLVMVFIKDTLKADPSTFTFFFTITRSMSLWKPLIGLIEDRYSPFGYRIKSYVIISCCCCVAGCLAIYLLEPGLLLLCLLISLLHIAQAFGDVLAEGMTAITLKFEADLSRLDHQAPNVEEGSSFGFFTVARNFFRILTMFLGGVAAQYVTLGQGFLIMAVPPFVILGYTIIFFEEPTRKVPGAEMQGRRQARLSFSEKAKQILQIVRDPSLKYPLILLFVTFSNPNAAETIMYILTDPVEGGWSFQTYALNNFLVGVVYAATMTAVLGRVSKMKFWTVLYLSQLLFGVLMLTNFTLCIEDISFAAAFSIQTVAGVAYFFAVELAMVPFLARIPAACPRHLQAFAVDHFGALLALSHSVNGLLTGLLLSVLAITREDFDGFLEFSAVTFAVSVLMLLLLPVARDYRPHLFSRPKHSSRLSKSRIGSRVHRAMK